MNDVVGPLTLIGIHHENAASRTSILALQTFFRRSDFAIYEIGRIVNDTPDQAQSSRVILWRYSNFDFEVIEALVNGFFC